MRFATAKTAISASGTLCLISHTHQQQLLNLLILTVFACACSKGNNSVLIDTVFHIEDVRSLAMVRVSPSPNWGTQFKSAAHSN